MQDGTGREPDRIAIRAARPEDARGLAALHAASWRAAYRGILADAYLDGAMGAEREAAWSRRFAPETRRDAVVALAEREGSGEILGLACILPAEDPVWGSLIDNLHVRPDLKRMRLGARLLAAATRLLLPEHGATPLHLTVFDRNEVAIGAYESWGGRLAERLDHVEGDGRAHPIRRYTWESPAALLAGLERRGRP